MAVIPCFLGMIITWWVIVWQTVDDWHEENNEIAVETPSFDKWQSTKGVLVLLLLLGVLFLFNLPRDHVSLVAAGCLLLSRQMASRTMLSFIDWQLLVLFIGLFIVNQEFNRSDIVQHVANNLKSEEVTVYSPFSIFMASALLSNLISNVPAVMLLAPFATDQFTGSLLAMSSTLAGNMFIVGSIANIIVIAQAANFGIQITWKKHMSIGLPVSIVTLAFTALWLYMLHNSSLF
jgi:Na+/H+ antiporter NhaD/arsenite permease-like protein